jgi:hypothetical protein
MCRGRCVSWRWLAHFVACILNTAGHDWREVVLDIGPHGLNIGFLKEPANVVVEIMRVDWLGTCARKEANVTGEALVRWTHGSSEGDQATTFQVSATLF